MEVVSFIHCIILKVVSARAINFMEVIAKLGGTPCTIVYMYVALGERSKK